MKNIRWSILIFLVLLVPIVQGMADYGDLDYGNCDYGVNSDPTIDSIQPTSVNPDFTSPINVTFNITGGDCENDASLAWFIDSVANVTDQNLSILFTGSTQTFNITGNLSDSFGFVIQSWTVNINITIAGNISDVLIVPIITATGNLLVITANVTAVDANLTGVSAFLNINENFLFLPSTPQNQSVGNIYTTNVTQVNWFISTSLTQKRELLNVTYYDDTNASFDGEQEDLIVKGDQEMSIAVIITVLVVIVIYFFILITLFTQREFTEHGLIRLLFFMIAFWVLLLPVDMALKYNDFVGGPPEISDHIALLHRIMVYLNWFIGFYFFLWVIVQMFKKVGTFNNT